MLLRLSRAVTPPTPNTSTITPPAYVMANPARIRHGRQLGQLGQPARAAARPPAPSPAVSRQPSAVSRQHPASSLQPSPSPERRERPAKPSEPFSRLLTRPAIIKRLQTAQPSPHGRSSARGSLEYPPSATLKVINTYVNNLLITC